MRQVAHNIGAELVLAIDQCDYYPAFAEEADRVAHVHSQGYIESVLDDALKVCAGEYVLRLDDDETCSPEMVEWLASGTWAQSDIWTFPRQHLWQDEQHYILNPPLWPDPQTRLMVREKAGARIGVHQACPFGAGHDTFAPIRHHKFLVRTKRERIALAEHYERITAGAGLSPTYKPFQLPEDCYAELDLAELTG